jgi:predicted MFS family arabinose efflux permease
VYHGRAWGRAIASYGAAIGLGTALGPLIGGAVTSGLGWRWIFYLNVPIGSAAIAISLTRVAEWRDHSSGGVDVAGALTLTAALVAVLLALTWSGSPGLADARTLLAIVVACASLALFVAIERRSRRPLLDLAILRNRMFMGVSLAAFAQAAAVYAMFLYLSLYLQTIRGLDPLQTGVQLLPQEAAGAVVAVVAGRLSVVLPVWWLIATGLALDAVGLVMLRGDVVAGDDASLTAALFVTGVGLGLVFPPVAATAPKVVAPERTGMASGACSTFQQFGTASGIALLGAVFQTYVSDHLVRVATTRPDDLAGAVATGQLHVASRLVGSRDVDLLHDVFTDGFGVVLLIGAAVAAIGVAVTWVLLRPASEPT